jgi:hypothetical protein
MKRVSEHEARVYRTVRDAVRWLSAREIAQRADVHVRTAQLHATGLSQLGVFKEARLSPAFLYKLAHPSAAHDNALVVLDEGSLR